MPNEEVTYLPMWRRYLNQFDPELLNFEEMGQLVYAMMRFHFLDMEPADLPEKLKICWSFLRPDLISAKSAYLSAVQNGKKGGRPKRTESKTQGNLPETQRNRIETHQNPPITQENREKPISESISESISITESMSDIDTRSAPSAPDGREGISKKKNSFGEFGWVKLTTSQYRTLSEEMGEEELRSCIAYIDEAAQSTQNKNRWKDWYLLLRRCYRDNWHRRSPPMTAKIPTGASGRLGTAELEAIQRVLQE